MNPLKHFTISAGVLDVFNLEVNAPDANTALELAQADWDQSKSANWTPCGATQKPNLQVEQEREIPPENTKTYAVCFYVTDLLEAEVQATSDEEALRVATAMRDAHGTYEGSFEITNSESSDMEIRGMHS